MANQDMQDNIQYRSLHNSAEKNIVNAFKIDHNLIAHPMFLNIHECDSFYQDWRPQLHVCTT